MPINIMIWGIYIVSVLPLYSKKINLETSSINLFFIIFFVSLLVFIACDNSGEPIVPEPGNVKMVEHMAADDTLAVERGIDAVPESDGIYLAWYSLDDRNISQYNIYRKKEDETFFDRIKSVDLETASPGKDTTFVDDNSDIGLDLNTYYYYYITATNTEGQESSPIDTLRYLLIEKPDLLRSDKDVYSSVMDSLPILFWSFVDIPDLFILRIENNFDQLQYIHIFQITEYFNDQTLDLNDREKVPGILDFPPGIYKWRIDAIGPDEDHSGAESNWKVFSIL